MSTLEKPHKNKWHMQNALIAIHTPTFKNNLDANMHTTTNT